MRKGARAETGTAATAAAPAPARAFDSTAGRDRAFWDAHSIVGAHIAWRADVEGAAGTMRPLWIDVEAAAATLADFHRNHGDAASLALIIARCRDFHVRSEQPPAALQALLIDLASTVPPKHSRRGRCAADLVERATWRTHALQIQVELNRGASSLDDAAGAVDGFSATAGAHSEPTLKNHYQWAIAEQVKVDKSE